MPYDVKKSGGQYCVFKTPDNEKMGCHKTRGEAVDQLRALYANEAEKATYASDISFNLASIEEAVYHLNLALENPEDMEAHVREALRILNEAPEGEKEMEAPEDHEAMPAEAPAPEYKAKEYAWEGPIVFEEKLTGDRRIFRTGSIEWADEDLPIPFRWQKSSTPGHTGAVPIGRVDKLERLENGAIYAYGVIIPSLNAEAAEYLRLMEAGVASGVSVDGDSAKFDVQETLDGEQTTVFSHMRLRSLTAVDIPAFKDAKVDLIDGEDTEELAKRKKRKKAIGNRAYTWNYAQEDALLAAAIPVLPKTEWFLEPKFDGPTGIKVTPDGAVFGHLALFDTCHIGFPGACVTPPKGSDYKYFHTGEIETQEGDLVSVGHLTFNTGHASMRAGAKDAAAHYDNTGTVAADVRCGEDEFGIWVAGALRPSLSDEDIRTFRAAPLSGDWRKIAGKLELVGALAVNVPGFPVPRVQALVASGETETLFTFDEPEVIDISEFETKLAETRLKARKAELAAKVHTFQQVYKTEDGERFPASDYAYVPDAEKPSTWKLRLTSTPGGDPDPQIVGAAVAALGEGFRGNKVEIPADDLAGVKAKVRAAWMKANPDKEADDMPDTIKE